MATFSINQVRHLYVAKTLKTAVDQLANAGDIFPTADTNKTTMYFQYMSPAGIVSSDKIDISKIISTKATASGDLAHKLTRYEVTLDDSVSATPVSGQEYIIRIAFTQYIGLSPEDQYYKYGSVTAKNSMTVSDFYKQMALSLAKNVYNETTPLVNIYLNRSGADGTDVPVLATTKESDLNQSDYDKIIIEETEQPWVLGMMPQAFIPFTVEFVPIVADGMEQLWGISEKVDSKKTVEDGHNIADLEYFCMGARGDQYRGMGYPNIIPTTYLVDPTQKYDTLDIHYYYVGNNESVQKSERTITLVCKDDGSHTDIKALIAAIKTVSGLTIADPA